MDLQDSSKDEADLAYFPFVRHSQESCTSLQSSIKSFRVVHIGVLFLQYNLNYCCWLSQVPAILKIGLSLVEAMTTAKVVKMAVPANFQRQRKVPFQNQIESCQRY